jgi:hypothetical protein
MTDSLQLVEQQAPANRSKRKKQALVILGCVLAFGVFAGIERPNIDFVDRKARQAEPRRQAIIEAFATRRLARMSTKQILSEFGTPEVGSGGTDSDGVQVFGYKNLWGGPTDEQWVNVAVKNGRGYLAWSSYLSGYDAWDEYKHRNKIVDDSAALSRGATGQ